MKINNLIKIEIYLVLAADGELDGVVARTFLFFVFLLVVDLNSMRNVSSTSEQSLTFLVMEISSFLCWVLYSCWKGSF